MTQEQNKKEDQGAVTGQQGVNKGLLTDEDPINVLAKKIEEASQNLSVDMIQEAVSLVNVWRKRQGISFLESPVSVKSHSQSA